MIFEEKVTWTDEMLRLYYYSSFKYFSDNHEYLMSRELFCLKRKLYFLKSSNFYKNIIDFIFFLTYFRNLLLNNGAFNCKISLYKHCFHIFIRFGRRLVSSSAWSIICYTIRSKIFSHCEVIDRHSRYSARCTNTIFYLSRVPFEIGLWSEV